MVRKRESKEIAVRGVDVTSSPPCLNIRTTFRALQNFTDLRKTVKLLHGSTRPESSSSVLQGFLGNSHNYYEGPSAEVGKKVLCVWDVDDTLVASGSPGVRQCPVFTEDELTSVFRSCSARHLLLSQGSVDDVFDCDGKLGFLAPFFLSGSTPIGKKSSKIAAGCRSMFVCSKPPDVRSHCHPELVVQDGGAPVVRIATIRAPREQADDAKCFLSGGADPPRCPSEVRWLVMRPSLWGISLASLSNFIVPSVHTAFLDGAVFRKMDIVRSLAASGEWDTVFFIDNDLSEVGLARPGLNIEDYYRMKSLGRLSRFFQSDLLLLQVSARMVEEAEEEGGKREREQEVQSLNSHDVAYHNNHNHEDKNHGQVIVNESLTPSMVTVGKENRIAHQNGNGDAQQMDFAGSVSMDLGGNSSTFMPARSHTSFRRVVDLFVAHLHLDGVKYRRITKAKQDAIDLSHKELWHPIFRTGPPCNDDAYADVMSSFFLYEAEVENYRKTSFFSLTPVPEWEPGVDVVLYPTYNRPRFPGYRSRQYHNICHQITTNVIDQWGSNMTQSQQYEMKKEVNSLYRRLIRRQPVIDPVLIAHLAGTLLSAFTSERRLSRTFTETLKKDIAVLVGENVPF